MLYSYTYFDQKVGRINFCYDRSRVLLNKIIIIPLPQNR